VSARPEPLGDGSLEAVPAESNPFASHAVRPGRLTYLFPGEQGSLETVAARFRVLGLRAQLVGPHGTGKSTLLARLLEHLREKGVVSHLVRLTHERPGLPPNWRPPRGAQLLALDGAEQLGPLAWRWVRARTRLARCGLLVTSHRDLGLPLLHKTSMDPSLARRVLGELLAGKQAPPSEAEVARLLAHHRGNLRDVLLALYERAAGI
jgi:hypothetical protein